jgi:hypothetical protein
MKSQADGSVTEGHGCKCIYDVELSQYHEESSLDKTADAAADQTCTGTGTKAGIGGHDRTTAILAEIHVCNCCCKLTQAGDLAQGVQ